MVIWIMLSPIPLLAFKKASFFYKHFFFISLFSHNLSALIFFKTIQMNVMLILALVSNYLK